MSVEALTASTVCDEYYYEWVRVRRDGRVVTEVDGLGLTDRVEVPVVLQ